MKRITSDVAEQLADKMRSMLRISSDEPINMKTTLRQLNILSVYRPMSKNIFGLSLKSADEKKFILINSNATRGRQHFTIAHELYHLYYDENPKPHFCTDSQIKAPSEYSADMFASALLLPRLSLASNIPLDELKNGYVSVDTALRLEQLFGVSHSTFVYRLKSLKIVNALTADALLNISVQHEAFLRGYDLSLYHNGNEGLVLGDYGVKAKKLFDEEKISEGHYLELMKKIGYGEGEDYSPNAKL